MWATNLTSQIGAMVQSTGASWLMASITPSATLVALVQSSSALPVVLLALLAGAMADLFNERRIMIASQSAGVLISLLLGILAWQARLTPAVLIALTFLIGVTVTLNAPSWQASVREQVPHASLGPAISLNSVALHASRSLGPALGGLIVAWKGPGAAFFTNVLCSLALLISLIGLRRVPVPRRKQKIVPAIVEGLQFMRRSALQRSVLVRAFGFSLSAVSIWALMPLVARDLLHGNSWEFGILFGCFGVGSLICAVAGTYLRATFTLEALAGLATLASALATILTALNLSSVVTALAMIMAGGSWVSAGATFSIAAQVAAPRELAGRIVSLFQMTFFGGMALGGALWGWLAQHFSLSAALWSSALSMLVSMALRSRWHLDWASTAP